MTSFTKVLLRPCAGALLIAGLFSTTAHAGLLFLGGGSVTSYGVTSYGGGPQALPVFIPNNVTTLTTGRNDIMATPGGGYQLANPIIANNLASYGPLGYPNYTFQLGGGNVNGPFGAGDTLVTPTTIGFRLSDPVPAGGSASYSITSTDTTFITDAFGFAGNIGSFLAIRGILPAGGSAAAASLMTEVSVDGAAFVYETALILAAAGNGNNVAFGGNGAVMLNTSAGFGGTYTGVAIDNWGFFGLVGAGHTVRVISTLTAFADPASIDSFFPDPQFLLDNSLVLPETLLSSDGASVPEPGMFMLVGGGLVLLGIRRRKRA